MQWLLKSRNDDVHMSGVDWIVLTANAVGVAVVVLASTHAQGNGAELAANDITADIEIASLR